MMLFFRAAPFAIALLAVPALAANPATSDNAGQSSQTAQPAPKKAKLFIFYRLHGWSNMNCVI